jgi:hypothetical protein
MASAVPLVFVPGFMASNLWRPAGGILTPPILAWPLNFYSLTAQLFLLEEQYPLKPNGLVPGYYEALIEALTLPTVQGGMGYTKGQDFWVFPYDWRVSCSTTGRELAQFVQEKLELANQQRTEKGLTAWDKVDVINHSMGSFLTRSAIIEYKMPVRRTVYIAAPHYGSPKAFFALHPNTVNGLIDDFVKDFLPGWYWNLLKAIPNVLLLRGWLRRMLTSFQSVYELLPDRFYLDEEHSLIIDATQTPELAVKGVENTYFRYVWQLPPNEARRVKQAMLFKERLGSHLPGTENLVIYSNSLPTFEYARFTSRIEYPERLTPGDLTVPAYSACQDEHAQHIVIAGVHSHLPDLPATHTAIKDFLTKNKTE